MRFPLKGGVADGVLRVEFAILKIKVKVGIRGWVNKKRVEGIEKKKQGNWGEMQKIHMTWQFLEGVFRYGLGECMYQNSGLYRFSCGQEPWHRQTDIYTSENKNIPCHLLASLLDYEKPQDDFYQTNPFCYIYIYLVYYVNFG